MGFTDSDINNVISKEDEKYEMKWNGIQKHIWMW
jgi:hypothetical protein